MTLNFLKVAIILAIVTYASTDAKTTKPPTSCASVRYSRITGKPTEKPDIVTMNVIMHGICRMRSNETQVTLPDYNAKADILISGLSLDPSEQTIYYSGMGYAIYKTNLADRKQEIVYTLDWDTRQIVGIIEDIAYDWIHRGVYIVFRNAVGYVDLKTNSSNLRILRNESQYQKIEVHPQRGYLFLLEEAYNNLIVRTNLEGADRVVVVNASGEFYQPNHQYARIEAMALDYEEERLYWSVAPSTKLIRHSALDGSDEQRFDSTPVFDAAAMAIGKKHIYYSRPGTISRYEKKTGFTDDWMFSIDNAGDISVGMLVLAENVGSNTGKTDAPTTSASGAASKPERLTTVPTGAASITLLPMMMLLSCLYVTALLAYP